MKHSCRIGVATTREKFEVVGFWMKFSLSLLSYVGVGRPYVEYIPSPRKKEKGIWTWTGKQTRSGDDDDGGIGMEVDAMCT